MLLLAAFYPVKSGRLQRLSGKAIYLLDGKETPNTLRIV